MGESSGAVASRLRKAFMEKHRDAHFLVIDRRSRRMIGAVYYAPDWADTPEVKERDLREFFAMVNELDQEWIRRSEDE